MKLLFNHSTRLKKILLQAAVLLLTLSCSSPEKQKLTHELTKLPLGSIKPSGWLKDQLEIQKNGLSGYLFEAWDDISNSTWTNGTRTAYYEEAVPYFLDGLLPLAYLLDDKDLISLAQTFVDSILSSQKTNGLFGPTDDKWPLSIATKALIQYYEATGDQKVIPFLTNYFRYLNEHPGDWPLGSVRGHRALETAISGYWLYRKTENPLILEVIESIERNSYNYNTHFHDYPWDSIALEKNHVPRFSQKMHQTGHGVYQAMAIKYPGLLYQQYPELYYKTAVYKGLESLDKYHGQVGGKFSSDEHVSGKHPSQGTELCTTVELMYSMEKLLEVFADPEFADRLELLAYNSLPGSMTADCWTHQYHSQSNQVLVSVDDRQFYTGMNTSNIYGFSPTYPCCLSNFHQGWPKFIQHMWMENEEKELVALTYGPNEVKYNTGKQIITISSRTDYPFKETIEFTIDAAKAFSMAIHFRIPSWCNEAQFIYENDTITSSGGKFLIVDRNWKPGVDFTLHFPMKVQLEERYRGSVSVKRGPLYFVLQIKPQFEKIRLETKIKPGMDAITQTSIDFMGTADWEIKPLSTWNYVLVIDKNSPESLFRVKTNPISAFPFASQGEMVYISSGKKHVIWDQPPPVEIFAEGKILESWGMEKNSAAAPPESPVHVNTEVQEITLIPYGSSRLRIAEFPWISNQ
jgi:uncharacterized protein